MDPIKQHGFGETAMKHPNIGFSVVVPAYNRAALLPRCIESLCRQTHHEFEVIIVDDGSTDDTGDVAKRFASSDHRIRYVHQENQGAAEARNHGARIANHEYLVFLDSDDEVLPEWLAAFSNCLRANAADVACCGCRFLNEQGESYHVRLPDDPANVPVHCWGFFFTGTFAIRRNVFDEIGGYTSGLPANQHTELRLRLLPQCEQRGWKVACIQEALVLRYLHDGPNIRSDVRAVYESGVFILNHHGDVYRRVPSHFATWAATVGSSAARLRKYPEARQWFCKAVQFSPYRWKNYVRLMAVCLPGLRTYIWPSDPSN